MPKITKLFPAGSFVGKHGQLYKFIYEFDDGTLLQASHKTEKSPFNVGDVAEYEIRGEYNGTKEGKVSKPDSFGKSGAASPETQRRIDASWAIGQALTMGQTQTTDQLVENAEWILNARNELLKKLQ